MKSGWEIVPLEQLCSIKSGKSDTQDAVEDGAYAFFDRSRTIKKSSRYLYDCEALIIPGEGTEFLPKHFIGKFDLHQRAYALFDFSDRIDVKFLYYFLHHLCDYFPSVAVGATVKSLRLRHFEQLPVSLTTIPEQQRIVSILDEAFDGIATAKANAEKNLQNARALFESHLQSVFTQRGEGWVVRKISEVAKHSLGKMLDKAKNKGELQPYLRNINVRWFTFEPLSNSKWVMLHSEQPMRHDCTFILWWVRQCRIKSLKPLLELPILGISRVLNSMPNRRACPFISIS